MSSCSPAPLDFGSSPSLEFTREDYLRGSSSINPLFIKTNSLDAFALKGSSATPSLDSWQKAIDSINKLNLSNGNSNKASSTKSYFDFNPIGLTPLKGSPTT